MGTREIPKSEPECLSLPPCEDAIVWLDSREIAPNNADENAPVSTHALPPSTTCPTDSFRWKLSAHSPVDSTITFRVPLAADVP